MHLDSDWILRWAERALLAGVLAVLVVAVAPRITSFPATDEGVYLTVADRIGHGQVIYRDLFQFLPPGYFCFLAAQMKLFGAGLAGLRISMLLVLAMHASILFVIARRVESFPLAAAGFTAMFLLHQADGAYILNHHLLSLTLADLAFLLIVLHRDGRPGALAAGAVTTSLCLLTTQTHGALTGVASLAYLWATRPAQGLKREIVRYAAWAAAAPAALCVWLAVTGALRPAWESCGGWVYTNYRRFESGTAYFAGGLAPLHRLLAGERSFHLVAESAVALFTGYGQMLSIAILSILLLRHSAVIEEKRRDLIGLALFAVTGWLGCFSFPNAHLVVQSSMLGYLIGYLLIVRLGMLLSASGRRAGTVILVTLALALPLKLAEVSRHLLKENARAVRESFQIRGQKLWIDPRGQGGQLDLMRFLMRNLPTGSDLFAFDWSAWVYYFGEYRNPTRYDGIWPVYNSSEQVAEAIGDLERSRPRYVIRDDLIERFIARGDPRFTRLDRQQLAQWPLFRYVEEQYRQIRTFGGYRVYERR